MKPRLKTKSCPEGCKAPLDTWRNNEYCGETRRLVWYQYFTCWTCGHKEQERLSAKASN